MPTITFDYTPKNHTAPEPPLEPPEDWADEVDDIDERFDRFLGGTRWNMPKIEQNKHFKPYKLRSLLDAPTNGRGWSYTKNSQDGSSRKNQN